MMVCSSSPGCSTIGMLMFVLLASERGTPHPVMKKGVTQKVPGDCLVLDCSSSSETLGAAAASDQGQMTRRAQGANPEKTPKVIKGRRRQIEAGERRVLRPTPVCN